MTMSVEKRHFTCVTCPVGCEVDAELRDGEVVSMEGNLCAKGEEFVLQELKEPMRILTTTVRIKGAKWPVLPVRTDRAIPKRLFLQLMRELNSVELRAPVKMAATVLRDVDGTGANIVATRSMKRARKGKRA